MTTKEIISCSILVAMVLLLPFACPRKAPPLASLDIYKGADSLKRLDRSDWYLGEGHPWDTVTAYIYGSGGDSTKLNIVGLKPGHHYTIKIYKNEELDKFTTHSIDTIIGSFVVRIRSFGPDSPRKPLVLH